MPLILGWLLVLLAPTLVLAAPCTYGTDCYCDCAKFTTGQYANASCQAQGIPGDATALLWCEDFDAPSLTCVGADAPACASRIGAEGPAYGPPYDNAKHDPAYRGGNAYWYRRYGPGVNGTLWAGGQPPFPPTYGSVCGGNPPNTNLGYLCGTLMWDATNRWQANSIAAVAAFRDQDFNAEIPSLGVPSNKSGGGSGAFAGNA